MTYFAQEEPPGQVFSNAPRHGESRADFQGTPDVENVGKGIGNGKLEGHAEQHVPHTDERNLPPSALLATMLIAQRQGKIAMFFNPSREAWDCAVEKEEA